MSLPLTYPGFFLAKPVFSCILKMVFIIIVLELKNRKHGLFTLLQIPLWKWNEVGNSTSFQQVNVNWRKKKIKYRILTKSILSDDLVLINNISINVFHFFLLCWVNLYSLSVIYLMRCFQSLILLVRLWYSKVCDLFFWLEFI